MSRVLILGGGFGGIAAAHRLRKILPPQDEIILVDRQPYFMIGFHKTWVLLGESTMKNGRRSLRDLEKYGIQFVQGTVESIDPANRAAVVDGTRIEADAMIVALGATLDTDKVPGFSKYALNPYALADLETSHEILKNFKGGRVVIGIFGMPIKCPPAPYEIALLLDDWFKARGVSAQLTAFTPLPMSIPILGQSGCEGIESRLIAKRIPLLTNHTATAVEPGAVVFGDRRVPFDLLLGIPQHRAPDVIVESALAQPGGWIKPDPQTLETVFPGVFAVGDSTAVLMANGKPLPKAGVFAQGEAETAAERIAATLNGETPTAVYHGEGGCFLEVGGGKAMMVAGKFLAQPAPIVNLTDATAELMAEKDEFETSRLTAWFGG